MSRTDLVQLLDTTRVVAIVTRRADGARVATPIWAVVIDDVAYVRSAFGASARWYQHVRAGRPVEFVLADGALAETDRDAALALPAAAVSLEAVAVDDAVQARISAALWAKYADEPENVEPVVSDGAVACTFRVAESV